MFLELSKYLLSNLNNPATVMSRCLELFEIHLTICANLHRDSCEFQARQTLAALAATSTMWFHPVAEMLWEDIPTIISLLKCMPEDLWQTTIVRVENNELPTLKIMLSHRINV